MISSDIQDLPSEQALSNLWQKAHALSSGLVTEDGRTFRIAYPGRPNARAGPDFLDAVLLTEFGQRVTGDIELHLNAPDWNSHHHDVDPNYNGVVLHVVLRPKGRVASAQQSGMQAPIVSITSIKGSLIKNSESFPEPFLSGAKESDIGEMLDVAGDERFLAKSKGFSIEMASSDAEQVLYRAIMEALGYASNRKPLRELAERVPFRLVSGLRREPASMRLHGVRAMLIGTSGLASRLASDDAKLLRKLCRHLPRTRTMSPDSWHTFRVRPSNHPLKRIEGAAILVDRFLDSGVVRWLQDCVFTDWRALGARLTVAPFIGKSRASDIVINAVLPFLHAYGKIGRSHELSERCLEIYGAYPKLAENEVTREMRRLLNADDTGLKIATARRQQGLIQLYKTIPNRLSTASFP